MFCPKCGNEIPDSAAFCPKCGNGIGREEGAPTEPAKRKRKGMLIGVAAGAVAVVAVVAIAVYVVFFRPYDIDERTFPDAPLREAIERQGDKDGDEKLSREEAASIEMLDLANSSLASFDGMQLLPNLTRLNVAGCGDLTNPDYSKVGGLAELDVHGSGVTEVDAGKMSELRKLSASETLIFNLDVSGNASLSALDVDDAVEVTGLDSTLLKEQWLLTSYTAKGYRGVSETGGVGGPSITLETITFQYDDLNELLEADVHTESSANTAVDRILAYDRDETGALLFYGEYNDGGSSATGYDYLLDSSGRIVSSVTASTIPSYDGEEVDYEYDSDGRLARESYITNGSGRSSGTTYEYNDASQLISIRSAEGYTLTALSYGDNGLVNRFENNYGIFEFEYDAEGRCIAKHVHDGNAPMAQGDASYSYDEQGRLVSARRSCDSSVYSFDMEVACSYDSHGNEVHRDLSMRSPSGSTNTGTVDFDYKRMFVAKEEPDLKKPLLCGDPTCSIGIQGPMQMGLFANESEIVKASLRNTGAVSFNYFV